MTRALGGLLVLLLPTVVQAEATDSRFSPQPILYMIDGYLDSAPTGTQAQERVTIGWAGHSRVFLLTSYTRSGYHGDPWLLINNLGAYHPDFLLIGTEPVVAAILEAAPGSRVRGKFQYLPGIHSLVIDPYQLTVE